MKQTSNHRVKMVLIMFTLLFSVMTLTVHAIDSNHTNLLLQAIQLDSRISATNLKISQHTGRYVITGTVSSLSSKDLLEEIVAGIVGEHYSVKGLNVKPPLVSDEDIRNAINVAVPSHCQVDIKDFKVEVRNAMVTLSGIGKTLHHHWIAGSLARGTTGVKSVINNIAIVGERKSDQLLQENILILIQSSFPENSIYDLRVTVLDGHVKIAGSTNHFLNKKRIEEILRSMNGVTSIANQVLVKQRVLNKYRQSEF